MGGCLRLAHKHSLAPYRADISSATIICMLRVGMYVICKIWPRIMYTQQFSMRAAKLLAPNWREHKAPHDYATRWQFQWLNNRTMKSLLLQNQQIIKKAVLKTPNCQTCLFVVQVERIMWTINNRHLITRPNIMSCMCSSNFVKHTTNSRRVGEKKIPNECF